MIASAKPANQLGRRKSSSLSSRSALRQQKGPSPKDHSTERQKRRRRNTNRSLARSLAVSLSLPLHYGGTWKSASSASSASRRWGGKQEILSD